MNQDNPQLHNEPEPYDPQLHNEPEQVRPSAAL